MHSRLNETDLRSLPQWNACCGLLCLQTYPLDVVVKFKCTKLESVSFECMCQLILLSVV